MAKTDNYQTLSKRLDEVVAAIQAPDISVDEAIAAYEEGMALVAKLQEYLKTAENRIHKLQNKTDA